MINCPVIWVPVDMTRSAEEPNFGSLLPDRSQSTKRRRSVPGRFHLHAPVRRQSIYCENSRPGSQQGGMLIECLAFCLTILSSFANFSGYTATSHVHSACTQQFSPELANPCIGRSTYHQAVLCFSNQQISLPLLRNVAEYNGQLLCGTCTDTFITFATWQKKIQKNFGKIYKDVAFPIHWRPRPGARRSAPAAAKKARCLAAVVLPKSGPSAVRWIHCWTPDASSKRLLQSVCARSFHLENVNLWQV